LVCSHRDRKASGCWDGDFFLLISEVRPLEQSQLKGEPQGYFVVVPAPAGETGDFDFRLLLLRLWEGRLLLLATILTTALLAGVHAILTVRSDSQSAVRIGGQLGGLASLAGLAGMNLGDRREEFLAVLKSRRLMREFIDRHALMPILFKSSWDPDTASFRPNLFGRIPSIDDGVDAFEKLRNIRDEARTGLIRISLEWSDPDQAAQWVNQYVALANELLRQQAIATSRNSIEFLDQELSHTKFDSVRQTLYRLLESRLNEAMLASRNSLSE
jgi:uncharacterized protein involved in exopolysaccharide biosynthesis